MEVDCEGCAGCCLDWRSIAPEDVSLDHERRGSLAPLDDAYNLVPLSSDEVRAFLRAGFGDAMTPRLFADADGVTIDGHAVAAVADRPAFVIGLRASPKPVAPFGLDATWLRACVFLDPTTLQCRIHGSDRYPDTCETYPANNLALDVEAECERVERAFGGERLLDDDPAGATPLLGVGALGATVFAHPAPDRLSGVVSRIATGAPTPSDRAEFVAVAAASRPGSADVDSQRYEAALETALEADSWVGRSVTAWSQCFERGDEAEPALAEHIEVAAGAPETSGWE